MTRTELQVGGERSTWWSAALLIGAGLMLVLLFGALARLPEIATKDHFWFQGYIGLAAVSYLIAGSVAHKISWNSYWTLFVIGVGVLGPFWLVGKAPGLSDDVYRYLFEGYSLSQGVNPYVISPLENPLEHPVKQLVNHPEYTAIYPPLFQWVMAAFMMLGGTLTVLQWCMLAIHLGLLIVMARALRPVSHHLIWFAWCPLVWVEGVWSCHLDFLGAACVLVAALFLSSRPVRRNAQIVGICLGIGVGLKYLPLVLLPYFIVVAYRRGWRRGEYLAAAGTFLFCTLVPVIPFLVDYLLSAGSSHPGSSLIAYARHWSFNSPFFSLLGWLSLEVWTRKLILALCWLLIMGVITLRNTEPRRDPGLLLWSVPLCMPVAYPWYFLWGLCFLPWFVRNSEIPAMRRPDPVALGFATLSCTLLWSYQVLPAYHQSGLWQESAVLLMVEFLIPLIVWGCASWWTCLCSQMPNQAYSQTLAPSISESVAEISAS